MSYDYNSPTPSTIRSMGIWNRMPGSTCRKYFRVRKGAKVSEVELHINQKSRMASGDVCRGEKMQLFVLLHLLLANHEVIRSMQKCIDIFSKIYKFPLSFTYDLNTDSSTLHSSQADMLVCVRINGYLPPCQAKSSLFPRHTKPEDQCKA